MLKRPRLERMRAIGVALAAVMGSIAGAGAEAYPSRPITIVVPYAAGGLFDSIARALAESMRGALAQSVVIENVGGAGGSIALGRVARAAPDGYTLSVGSGDQFVVNAAIYPLQYDVVQDFEPVTLLMNGPNLIVSKNEIPASNLKGVGGVAQDQPRQCCAGAQWRRRLAPSLRRRAATRHRRALALRPLSRRRPGIAGRDRRTH
jgi:tripartite-type tricarboxylate transporter receptor subunit TctC